MTIDLLQTAQEVAQSLIRNARAEWGTDDWASWQQLVESFLQGAQGQPPGRICTPLAHQAWRAGQTHLRMSANAPSRMAPVYRWKGMSK